VHHLSHATDELNFLVSFFVTLLKLWDSARFKPVCVQIPTYADNVALPTFVCCTPCCCVPCNNRSVSSAGQAHSNKPAAVGLLLWAHVGTDRQMDRQMDGWTDARQMHRAYNAIRLFVAPQLLAIRVAVISCR